MRGRVAGEKDGDELGADRTGVVEQLPDDPRLPDDAQPLARRFVAADPAVIALGADHQHEVGRLDLPLAPQRPALGRCGVVLIDLRVYAAGAQTVGERQRALLMLDRIVTVTDEHPRRACLLLADR